LRQVQKKQSHHKHKKSKRDKGEMGCKNETKKFSSTNS
jgi:hypothetical protein